MGFFKFKKIRSLLIFIIALTAIIWIFQDNFLQISILKKSMSQSSFTEDLNKERPYLEKIENFSINEYSDNEKILSTINAERYFSYKNAPVELYKVKVRTFDDNQIEAAILSSKQAQIFENSEINFNGNVDIQTLNNIFHSLQSESLIFNPSNGEITSNKSVFYQGEGAKINSKGMLMNIDNDKLILMGSVSINEDSGSKIETSNLNIDQSDGKKIYRSKEKTTYRSAGNTIIAKSGIIMDMNKNLTNLVGKVEILDSLGEKIFTSDLLVDASKDEVTYKTDQPVEYISINSNIKANKMFYEGSAQKIDLLGGVYAIFK